MIGNCWLLILCWMVKNSALAVDPAREQLEIFLQQHSFPIGTLRKLSGEPVEDKEMDSLNQRLLFNSFFMESLTHFSREKIPERVVHANGAGAYGYFEVTHDITKICKAKLFNQVGKQTPVIVRFSSTAGEKGSSEVVRDTRGFATKFFTEDGNFDLVALHSPMFAIKDPIYFPSFSHILTRNPQTNLFDYNMFWDFMTSRPESIYLNLFLNSDLGIPLGYSYMPGYSIHTYQVYNELGESYFVRFHLEPYWGSQTLTSAQAANISGSQPFFFTHQLYNDIANGNYPSWYVRLQVLTLNDVKNADFDVFDVTRTLPEDKYPLYPLGKLVLISNLENFFEENEQLAFSPSNLVPGILGAPDKLFEARRFLYGDSQRYRLGVNFNNIQANRPILIQRNNFSDSVLTYNRAARPRVFSMRNAPNFFPNTFNGPVSYSDPNKPDLINVEQSEDAPVDQARAFYINLPADQKLRVIANIVASLKNAASFLQDRAIRMFYDVDANLAIQIKNSLGNIS